MKNIEVQAGVDGGSSAPFIPDVKYLGEQNALTVFELIRVLEPVSRADLTRETGIKPAALTGLVRYLIEEGLVVECEKQFSGIQGGRPSRMLRVNSGAHAVIGLDIEPDHLRMVVTDLGGAALQYKQISWNRYEEPERLFDQVRSWYRNINTGKAGVVGVGVSCAGLIEEENGVLISSTNMPKWKNVPIRKRLEEIFKVPVQIGRSIHQVAWAEHWFRNDPEGGDN